MAQCKLTPHEFIQNAFSPIVAVMNSPLVDQTCQKNNLSFTEMIQPFCKLNTEAHFRDPSGNGITVRNLRVTMLDINSRPPQPTLARKFLNESVSFSCNERNSTLQIGSVTVDVPSSVPWFEAWRETFLQVQFPSDHEFTKHYLSCILVVSSAEASPADSLIQMNQQLQQLQNVAPAKLPKWFCPNVLRYYILLHDIQDGNSEKAECVFENIKNTYGVNNCYFLQMNSRPPGQVEDQTHLPDPWSQFLIRHFDVQDGSDHDSSPRTPAELGLTSTPNRFSTESNCDGEFNAKEPELAQEAGETPSGAITVTRHPLSPSNDSDTLVSGSIGSNADKNNMDVGITPSHINSNVWAGHLGGQVTAQAAHGAYLTAGDLDRLRSLVQDFCIKALLPFVERQVQLLSDVVSNKKGVSRSLLSATKRWFGSNKPGVPNVNSPNNAVIYSSDAPELQLRRLGDLCFMFGHYTLAFQAYHSAKRDFSADQAWLYYAGALEMAALSAFMQGEPTRKAQEYMEESIVTYLNSCKMPQFATRATLLSTECLKGRGLYGEAAQQFIRMASEDSDLRSALLLEQAAYCFLKATRPFMTRKYAFHIVLAGHRFSKAGQRKHSLRCYRQGYQVYENKCWGLAEDHIHFAIGRQAINLKLMSEAVSAFAQVISPTSRQTSSQQAAYLREYMTAQQQLLNGEDMKDSNVVPELPLPIVDQSSVRVLVGPLPLLRPSNPDSNVVPASGVTFDDESQEGTRWPKLEESLVTAAQKQPPMIFKPTIQMFCNQTDNSRNPISVVGEPVSVQVELMNPFHVTIHIHDLCLLWTMKSSSGDSEAGIVESQILPLLVLLADSRQHVVLSVVPRSIGELHITGLSYKLVFPAIDTNSTTISICGKKIFQVKSRSRPVKGKKEPSLDKRLEILIVPTAPCLQVSFQGLNSEMICGEMKKVEVEFRNVGNAPLTSLYVATSAPELFVFEGQSSQIAGGLAFSIPLTAHSGGQLGVGQIHTSTFWICAPDVPVNTTLDMLVYYENVLSNVTPRYRLVRHSWTLHVAAGMQLIVTAQYSSNSETNKTDTEDSQMLNLTMQVKNMNQVHDTLMTEISMAQMILASPEWQLSKSVSLPKGLKLQAQESIHFLLEAQRSSRKVSDQNNISYLWLSEKEEIHSLFSCSPYMDFLNRYIYQKVPSDTSVELPTEQQSTVEQTSSPCLVNLCLLLRWQACVTTENTKRSVIGQTFIKVTRSGCLNISPLSLSKNISTSGLIEAERTVATDSRQNSSLEELQKLVTYSISHPPRVSHNFKNTRLCVVPVLLRLQNSSHQQLLVKLNTLGGSTMLSANKTQLYLPHTSTTFQWVGLAKAWLELAAYGCATVQLMAALGSPGTFDMGAHLEIWCCEPGAPAANAVRQTWRVESALIVSNSAS